MAQCRVFLLDESEIEIGFDVHAEGKELLESVCKYINLVEIDYFGLTVKDDTSTNKVWVRLDKSIKKQFPVSPSSWTFNFAVKYYPTDPFYLKEEITKYQLCLQIRDDLMCGRLPCPLETLAILSSYWLQSEFGDHKEDSMKINRYLASFKYISQSDKSIPGFENKIRKLYISRRGMPPCDADTQFLRLAKSLPLYGLHRYVTEGKDGSEKILGVGSCGIFEISDGDRPLKYKWGTIKNINYKKEKFYVKLLRSSPEGHSTKHTYKLTSPHVAKALWIDAVDQHVFFRVTGSDSTSSGPTPKTTPETDRGTLRTKKEKTGFWWSFRKKRPKTEAQVRAQSAHIKRPNPSVIRHSGFQRSSSSSSSHASVKSDSWESSSSSSSSETDMAKHRHSSFPLRSILKKEKSWKGKPTIKSPEEHKDSDDEGRPFTNDDFVDDEDPKDINHGTCSLLLTETIIEEDEEVDEPTKTSPDVNNQPRSIPEKVETVKCPEITVEFQPIPDIGECISQEEIRNKELTCPIVTVDICAELNSGKVSLEPNHKNESNLLSPPLVRKLTREAIEPYVAESKPSGDKEKNKSRFENRTIEAEPKLNRIQNKILRHQTKKREKPNSVVLSPPATEETNNVPTLLEISLHQYDAKNDEDEEDDRKTLGTASAVAVFGDDDMTIKDLADDVTIGDLTECSRERSDVADDDSQDDNESKITESSGTSISDLTDNTEELCSPNILDIILSKCFRNREYGYREIFGVKLRPVKGRSRQIKSSAFDLNEHISVATQIPTPPLANDLAKTDILQENNANFSGFREKTFIPSWPFDPDSLALNIDLDELDKEAIRTALYAQRDVKIKENCCRIQSNVDEVRGTEASSYRGLQTENFKAKTENVAGERESIKHDCHDYKLGDKTVETKSNKSTFLDGTSRFVIDSIPGIPLFNQSVVKSSGGTSLDESRCSSISSISSKETQANISPEKLVYPPSIQTYQTDLQEIPRVSVYQPDIVSTFTPRVEEIKSNKPKTKINEKVDLVEDSTQTSNPFVKPQDVMKTHESTNDNLNKVTQTVEGSESGRSTPSSISSFPSFVHSIFPLRKISSTSESITTPSSCQITTSPREVEDENDNDSTPSLSECSVKSVRGSILEANECEVEEMTLPMQDNLSDSQHTEITIIDFINENCYPHKVLNKSVRVSVEMLRIEDETETANSTFTDKIGSISKEADYVEDAMQASEKSSITTSATASLHEESPHNALPTQDALNKDRKESTSSLEACWSTVTNVTTSDESGQNSFDQTFFSDLTSGVHDFRMDNLNAPPTSNSSSTTDEESEFINEPDNQDSNISEQIEILVIEDNNDQDNLVFDTTISFDCSIPAQCRGNNIDPPSLSENAETLPLATTSIDIVMVEDGQTNKDTESETTYDMDEVQSPLDDTNASSTQTIID